MPGDQTEAETTTHRPVSRAMLPGTLVAALRGSGLPDSDPRPFAPRRTARDWFVDVTAFVLAACFGALLLWIEYAESDGALAPTLLVVDSVLGALACVALWWRRRWPFAIGIALALVAPVSASSAIAGLIALLTVAVHRRFALVVPVAVAHLVASAVYYAYRDYQGDPFGLDITVSLLLIAVIVGWGMFVRARRLLILELRQRVERAEAEQQLHADRARLAERTRIAREMHDVLAHKVSLITLHAGGLEVQSELPPDEVRRVAGLIRGTSRQALEELRGIVGVLRDRNGDGAAPEGPQPMLRDVARLVVESRRAGMKIEFHMSVERQEEAPDALGRNAYRVVQEALTNAYKHAPSTTVTVALHGGPEEGLTVVVRNPLPVGASASPVLPGAGSGLVGLSERVALSGGTLTHGVNDDHQFEVVAKLRWES